MIETERLILRKWCKEDFSAFAALNSCKHVCEFLPDVLSREQSDNLAKRIIAHFDRHGFGLFAVQRKDIGGFIGFTGLNIPNFKAHFMPAIEIGWRLAYEQWGRGFATEAAIAVCNYAFLTLHIDELVAYTAKNNMRSRKVMEKIGMTHNVQDDFNHPGLPAGHVLSEHVLYRLKNH